MSNPVEWQIRVWYNLFNLKKIILLGGTGSIGSSAVDVIRTHRGEFELVAVTALRSREKCEGIAAELGARAYVGDNAAVQAVEENEADICLVATVGESGYRPTLKAIEKGMDIALATKEVMVMAGAEVTAAAKARGVRFLPVDSEHNAIFQCLQGGGEVARLVLTCSGGPFLNGPEDLSAVTPEMALAHPRWRMGPKVTIDSATMMNKGFEIIEAHWLFGIDVERIDVVIHPESIIHSMVEFTDGSTLAQLAEPDMRVPIQYALSWPRRLPAKRKRLDLSAYGKLTFGRPDESRFPCLRLAREAVRAGGDACARLARADEVAVARFLAGEMKFSEIPEFLERSIK